MRRRSPLKRTRALRQRRALKWKGRPAKTVRQKGRIVASLDDYKVLVKRVVYGELCAAGCGQRANSAHHIVSRAQGGDDVLDNLVGLCGDGVAGCHGKVEARDPTVRRHLYERLPPAKVAYAERKMGEGWLARQYATAEGGT